MEDLVMKKGTILYLKNNEEEEALDQDQYYDIPMTPRTSPEVRYRNTSPKYFDNQTNK